MPKVRSLTFRLVPRLQVMRRGIGFVEGHVELDAAANFEGLNETDARNLRSRMEHWVAGNDKPKNWFHRFDDFRECFVFKLPGRRWYGFLFHPLPKTSPRFQLCVLAIHAYKHEQATDKAELRRVNEWLQHPAVRRAISVIYRDDDRKEQR
jgi:hypothetical protein